ncbi:LapA family protein [Psychrobacter sp. M13]|uniref:LapA family protein n=1 Tax=Psychrobacter sp. M13 TaxID=3067275 RepID=UPI00273A889D|nr:LapA family protein [Psychrobacter sp. M13]WLP95411.1 LapA family protein [Psychrobacter sp. M13]
MRFILFVLLFLSFAYAIGLVLANNADIGVNLLFSQAPTMNLGLLLILCMTLGIVIGLLLALLLFRVFQNKWEISQLKKSNAKLQEQLTQANVVIDRQANVPTVDEAGYPASSVPVDVDNNLSTQKTALLSKRQRD